MNTTKIIRMKCGHVCVIRFINVLSQWIFVFSTAAADGVSVAAILQKGKKYDFGGARVFVYSPASCVCCVHCARSDETRTKLSSCAVH